MAPKTFWKEVTHSMKFFIPLLIGEIIGGIVFGASKISYFGLNPFTTGAIIGIIAGAIYILLGPRFK